MEYMHCKLKVVPMESQCDCKKEKYILYYVILCYIILYYTPHTHTHPNCVFIEARPLLSNTKRFKSRASGTVKKRKQLIVLVVQQLNLEF